MFRNHCIKVRIHETFGFGDSIPTTTIYHFFDVNDKVIKKSTYHGEVLTPASTENYMYNDDGLKIKSEEYRFKGSDTIVKTTHYRYNLHGDIDSNSNGYITYQYDSIGKILESKWFIPNPVKVDDSLESNILYEYNSNGKIIKTTEFINHWISEVNSFDLDNKSRVIKRTMLYYKLGTLEITSVYEQTYLYDYKGLLIKMVQQKIGGSEAHGKLAGCIDSFYKYEFY